MKHSPGPFSSSATLSSDLYNIRYISDADGRDIAVVRHPLEMSQEEALANAALLKSSFVLAEACQHLLPFAMAYQDARRGGADATPTLAMAQAALAQAGRMPANPQSNRLVNRMDDLVRTIDAGEDVSVKAERLLKAMNQLHAAQEAEDSGAVDDAETYLSECFRSLQGEIFEFRKRAALSLHREAVEMLCLKADPVTSAEEPEHDNDTARNV